VKLQFKKRRLIPVALAILVLVVGSGVAYAFWTSGGSGTGGGSVANPANDLTVTGSALTPMYPGLANQDTSVTITNNAAASVHITTVTITGVTTSDETNCQGSVNFSHGGAVTIPAGGVEIAGGGAGFATVVGPTIQFNNLPVNQNACKGVTVNIAFSVS